MSRSYKPLSEYTHGVYGEDVLELDLDPVDEQDLIDNGHLELQPCTYRRLTESFVGADVEVGETYKADYSLLAEASLVDAGHIERVEDEPEKKPAKKAAKKSSSKKSTDN